MMKQLITSIFVLLLAACSAQTSMTAVPTLSATLTPSPQPSATVEPTATPMPGTVVIPIEQMSKGIPWLPLDKNAVPGTYFIKFNLQKPPFDNVLVRQAFAAATDREAIAALTQKYGITVPEPATSLTHPLVMGRNLYNEVGIPFDPVKAREYFSETGYSETNKFPDVTFLVYLNPSGKVPAYHQKVAEALVAMWKEALGIEVTVVTVSYAQYKKLMITDPAGLFLVGWMADEIDPQNFLTLMFHTNSPGSTNEFSNADFDYLVDKATLTRDPSERQALYIQAERILCEVEAAVIPLYYRIF